MFGSRRVFFSSKMSCHLGEIPKLCLFSRVFIPRRAIEISDKFDVSGAQLSFFPSEGSISWVNSQSFVSFLGFLSPFHLSFHPLLPAHWLPSQNPPHQVIISHQPSVVVVQQHPLHPISSAWMRFQPHQCIHVSSHRLLKWHLLHLDILPNHLARHLAYLPITHWWCGAGKLICSVEVFLPLF